MKIDQVIAPPATPDRLFVSCPNEGGLIYMGPDSSRVIDFVDTIGLCVTSEIFVRAYQTLNGAKLDIISLGGASVLEVPEPVDLHDVLVHDGEIFLVSTGTNEVLVYDMDGSLSRRVAYPGEPDSHHLNCLGILDGQLTVAAFGNFQATRGWAGGESAGRGFVAPLDGTRSTELLWQGLDQPHTQRQFGNEWYVCDSRRHALVRRGPHGRQEISFAPFFTRGLALAGNRLYLGLSASRNVDARYSQGAVAILDRVSLETIGTLPLPFAEVYDIVAPSDELCGAVLAHYESQTSAIPSGWTLATGLTRRLALQTEAGCGQALLEWTRDGEFCDRDAIRQTVPERRLVRLRLPVPSAEHAVRFRFSPAQAVGEVLVDELSFIGEANCATVDLLPQIEAERPENGTPLPLGERRWLVRSPGEAFHISRPPDWTGQGFLCASFRYFRSVDSVTKELQRLSDLQRRTLEEKAAEITSARAGFELLAKEMEGALEEERARVRRMADKISRMQRSFSWRVTSPLRLIRRVLLRK